MHRMAKAAEWPLWILACAGLGALFGLLNIHPATRQHIHITRDMRIIFDARLGAVALVFCVMLLLATGPAQRRMAERRKNREAALEAKRATMLKHADPVIATVGRHEKTLGELAAGTRAVEMKVDNLLATFADVLDGHGDAPAALQKTMPMLRLVVDNSGDEEKDAS